MVLNGAESAIICGVAVIKEFTLSEGAALFLHRRKALRFSFIVGRRCAFPSLSEGAALFRPTFEYNI